MARPRRNRAARRNAQRAAQNAARRGLAPPDDGEVRRLAPPPAIERIKDRLTEAEYQAALALKILWSAGTLNRADTSSHIARFGMGGHCAYGDVDDDRLEAHDRLRAACRAMGMGLSARFALEVVCYEVRVTTLEELCHLRDALARLAAHLRMVTRAKAA